jgi:septal ring factor EnvC (AmiA/AmiB activator)
MAIRWILPLLLLSLPAVLNAAPDMNKAKSDLEQVRQRIGTVKSSLDTAEKRHQALLDELRKVERGIGSITGSLRTIDKKLRSQRLRLGLLRGDRQEQLESLETQKKALRGQVRAAYAMGRQQKVKLLLNQEEPATVGRIMMYYQYLNRSRVDEVESIRKNLKNLRRTEQEIGKEEQRLAALREREEQQKQDLELSFKARQEVMAALDEEIQSKGSELATLQMNEQRLKQLLARLQKEQQARAAKGLDTRAPFQQLRGKLQWPSSGLLVDTYGSERGGGARWNGVVISTTDGTEVRAIHHGQVVFADWLRGYGLLLILDHGNGYLSLYGHNRSLFKGVGDRVRPGEALALVGSSGGREDPGVYFEVRHNGHPADPKVWCVPIKGKRINMDVMASSNL